MDRFRLNAEGTVQVCVHFGCVVDSFLFWGNQCEEGGGVNDFLRCHFLSIDRFHVKPRLRVDTTCVCDSGWFVVAEVASL